MRVTVSILLPLLFPERSATLHIASVFGGDPSRIFCLLVERGDGVGGGQRSSDRFGFYWPANQLGSKIFLRPSSANMDLF